MLRIFHCRILIVLSGMLFLYAPLSFAQTTCGDLITTSLEEFPVDENDPEGEWVWIEVESREPIEDCDNPFNSDDPLPFDVELMLNNQQILNNSTVSVP